MTNRMTMFLCMVTLCTGAAAASAQPEGCRGGPPGSGARGDGGGSRPDLLLTFAEELSLSDPQVTAIEAIRDEVKPRETELENSLERVRHDLRGLMLEDTLDEGDVIQALVQVGETRTELEVTRMRARLAARAVLTGEQRDTLRDLAREHQGRRRGHRGGGGRGPGTDG